MHKYEIDNHGIMEDIIFHHKGGAGMQWTITLNQEANEQLKHLEAMTHRDSKQLLEEMVTDAISQKLNKLKAIQDGLEDVSAGRMVAHDTVIAGLDEMLKSAGLTIDEA